VPNGTSDDEYLAEAAAVCPDGERVLSGGFVQNVRRLGEVFINVPNEDGTAWLVVAINWDNPDPPEAGELTSVAYCVPDPEASKAPYAQRKAAAEQQARSLRLKYNKTRD
jgi:hypothetical protein